MGVDTGGYAGYPMSVSKIREGSGGRKWTINLLGVGARSSCGSFASPTRGLSIDLLVERGLLLHLRSSSRQEAN